MLLAKQKIQGTLKTLRNFPVDIDHKERAGWMVFYLKNGWEISSQRKKSSFDHWQLPGSSSYWESVTRKISFFATEYYISESADGSSRNKMSQGPLQETISKTDTAQYRF